MRLERSPGRWLCAYLRLRSDSLVTQERDRLRSGSLMTGGPLPPGSGFGTQSTKNPPREGGFLSMNLTLSSIKSSLIGRVFCSIIFGVTSLESSCVPKSPAGHTYQIIYFSLIYTRLSGKHLGFIEHFSYLSLFKQKPHEAWFQLRCQSQKFENLTLVARRRKHFWVFWVIYVCFYSR